MVAAVVAMAGDDGCDSDPFGIVGRTLSGKYAVTRLLGQGGMGVVYEAEHRLLGRRCALKLIKVYGVRDKQTFLKRFLREARLGVELRHPGIVEVYDVDTFTDGVTPFIVMELLDGRSLGDRLREAGRLDWREAFDLVARACAPLACAHAHGVVHRDLKPDNLFLCRDGTLKVLDFGIARLGDQERLTSTGLLMGTPHYMSREQLAGAADLDGRADVYALGVVLYHAITGRLIFEAHDFLELVAKITSEQPIDVSQILPSLPPGAAQVIRTALAPDRSRRQKSADALAADLTAALAQDGRATSAPFSSSSSESPTVAARGPAALRDAAAERARRLGPKIFFAALALGIAAGSAAAVYAVRSARPRPVAGAQVPPLALPSSDGPRPGHVRLVSTPPGATVTRAGRAVGVTPLDLEGAADQLVDVELSLDGYQARAERVLPTLEGGTAELALRPLTGTLQVYALPFAEVTVDGRAAGETPLRALALKAGEHVVELKNAGLGRSARRPVHIEPGRTTRIQIKW